MNVAEQLLPDPQGVFLLVHKFFWQEAEQLCALLLQEVLPDFEVFSVDPVKLHLLVPGPETTKLYV